MSSLPHLKLPDGLHLQPSTTCAPRPPSHVHPSPAMANTSRSTKSRVSTQSVASKPPAVPPRTAQPAAVQSRIAQPAAVQSRIAQPAAVPPRIAQPAAVQPTRVQQTVVQLTIKQPATVQPPTTQPLAVQPTTQPVAVRPTTQPLAVQPTTQPVAVQPTAQPVAVRPTTQPVAVQPTTQPVAVQPTAQPVAVRPTTQPVAVQPTTQPVAVQPTTQPLAVQPTTQPVAVQPTTQPVAVQPTTQPLAVQPTTQPVAVRPTTQPVAVQPTTPPVAVRPTTQPVAVRPTTQPVAVRPTTQPVAVRPTTQPVAVQPTTQPVAVRPTTQPVAVQPTTQAPGKVHPAVIQPTTREARAAQPTTPQVGSYPLAIHPTQPPWKKNFCRDSEPVTKKRRLLEATEAVVGHEMTKTGSKQEDAEDILARVCSAVGIDSDLVESVVDDPPPHNHQSELVGNTHVFPGSLQYLRGVRPLHPSIPSLAHRLRRPEFRFHSSMHPAYRISPDGSYALAQVRHPYQQYHHRPREPAYMVPHRIAIRPGEPHHYRPFPHYFNRYQYVGPLPHIMNRPPMLRPGPPIGPSDRHLPAPHSTPNLPQPSDLCHYPPRTLHQSPPRPPALQPDPRRGPPDVHHAPHTVTDVKHRHPLRHSDSEVPYRIPTPHHNSCGITSSVSERPAATATSRSFTSSQTPFQPSLPDSTGQHKQRAGVHEMSIPSTSVNPLHPQGPPYPIITHPGRGQYHHLYTQGSESYSKHPYTPRAEPARDPVWQENVSSRAPIMSSRTSPDNRPRTSVQARPSYVPEQLQHRYDQTWGVKRPSSDSDRAPEVVQVRRTMEPPKPCVELIPIGPSRDTRERKSVGEEDSHISVSVMQKQIAPATDPHQQRVNTNSSQHSQLPGRTFVNVDHKALIAAYGQSAHVQVPAAYVAQTPSLQHNHQDRISISLSANPEVPSPTSPRKVLRRPLSSDPSFNRNFSSREETPKSEAQKGQRYNRSNSEPSSTQCKADNDNNEPCSTQCIADNKSNSELSRTQCRAENRSNSEPTRTQCRADNRSKSEPSRTQCRADNDNNEPSRTQCRADNRSNSEPSRTQCRVDNDNNEPSSTQSRADNDNNEPNSTQSRADNDNNEPSRTQCRDDIDKCNTSVRKTDSHCSTHEIFSPVDDAKKQTTSSRTSSEGGKPQMDIHYRKVSQGQISLLDTNEGHRFTPDNERQISTPNEERQISTPDNDITVEKIVYFTNRDRDLQENVQHKTRDHDLPHNVQNKTRWLESHYTADPENIEREARGLSSGVHSSRYVTHHRSASEPPHGLLSASIDTVSPNKRPASLPGAGQQGLFNPVTMKCQNDLNVTFQQDQRNPFSENPSELDSDEVFMERLKLVLNDLLSVPEATKLQQLSCSPEQLLASVVQRGGAHPSKDLSPRKRLREDFKTVVKLSLPADLLRDWGWDSCTPDQILDQLIKVTHNGDDSVNGSVIATLSSPLTHDDSLEDDVFSPSPCNAPDPHIPRPYIHATHVPEPPHDLVSQGPHIRVVKPFADTSTTYTMHHHVPVSYVPTVCAIPPHAPHNVSACSTSLHSHVLVSHPSDPHSTQVYKTGQEEHASPNQGKDSYPPPPDQAQHTAVKWPGSDSVVGSLECTPVNTKAPAT
ncbi:uncharacterized protein [Panulirus ornatus]|uniref:uncharacterized protein n=1 Tax=Panulirus ornatus TaxID=150431 RepID=UPI003A8BAB02